ncbi:acylglycerol kinase, mitochondrial-like, partial [Chionomys nivalis]|uniref:acylglycerol kinase, mitochondrial-like n=1 Tax=Chionomys nivalis TaxID=269649 RepID=UPI002593063A
MAYFLNKSGNKIEQLIEYHIAIVKGETVPLDILQIKGKKEQPVFAMTGLRWGSFRDAGVKVSKYWYLGPLKIKAAHFFSTLQSKEDFMNICIEPNAVSKGDFITIGNSTGWSGGRASISVETEGAVRQAKGLGGKTAASPRCLPDEPRLGRSFRAKWILYL